MAVFIPNGLLGPSKPAPTKDSNQAPMLAQIGSLETEEDSKTDLAVGTRLYSASSVRLEDSSVKVQSGLHEEEPLSETGKRTCTCPALYIPFNRQH